MSTRVVTPETQALLGRLKKTDPEAWPRLVARPRPKPAEEMVEYVHVYDLPEISAVEVHIYKFDPEAWLRTPLGQRPALTTWCGEGADQRPRGDAVWVPCRRCMRAARAFAAAARPASPKP